MTRFIHDQFAKQILTELLTPFGQVETSKDITSEIRQIDVLFTPFPNQVTSTAIALLERMASAIALFEPFRNPVTKSDIRSCLGKLFALHSAQARQANRDNTRLEETALPFLWILTPTASEDLLQSLKANLQENWSNGIYFLPEALKTAIIVIHKLDRTPETLWLRILGRGTVQQQAIQELENLAPDHPFRETILELVYDLLAVLETRQQTQQDLDTEDRELIMQLSPIYQQRLAEATQKGVQQERRAMVESLLQIRFGTIDGELAPLVDRLTTLEAHAFTALILQSSREELLQSLRQP